MYLESKALALAGGLDACLDGSRWLAQAVVAELVVFDTRGTSMWMSMRSSSGPEMRFWYLVTMVVEQVQGLTGSP